jgi:hypothetical protein
MTDEEIRAAGGKTEADQRGDYLKALEYERDGYLSVGKDERAKQVDAVIKNLTAKAKPAPKATREA